MLLCGPWWAVAFPLEKSCCLRVLDLTSGCITTYQVRGSPLCWPIKEWQVTSFPRGRQLVPLNCLKLNTTGPRNSTQALEMMIPTLSLTWQKWLTPPSRPFRTNRAHWTHQPSCWWVTRSLWGHLLAEQGVLANTSFCVYINNLGKVKNEVEKNHAKAGWLSSVNPEFPLHSLWPLQLAKLWHLGLLAECHTPKKVWPLQKVLLVALTTCRFHCAGSVGLCGAWTTQNISLPHVRGGQWPCWVWQALLFLASCWGQGLDCWGSSHCMTCIFAPGLPVGALGLEQSLIWRPGLEQSLIWRAGAKLLLGLTVSHIRRNRPLLWEAVNFLVFPKHVFYLAPGEPHQYICPLPSPQEENGVFNFSGVYAVHPVCHLSGVTRWPWETRTHHRCWPCCIISPF